MNGGEALFAQISGEQFQTSVADGISPVCWVNILLYWAGHIYVWTYSLSKKVEKGLTDWSEDAGAM